jgi:hypothetical protein
MMSDQRIQNDATIGDIVGGLNARTEYVRRVVDHMWDCRRQFGAASVRIGIMGQGRAPNYRIEYPKEPDGTPTVFAAYNGLGHKQIEDLGELSVAALFRLSDEPMPERTLRHEHWSSRVMDLDEVNNRCWTSAPL